LELGCLSALYFLEYYLELAFAGNECWGQRFCGDKNVWKFTNGARFFMGYDASKHVDTIDNDHKVVWTNLTPFQSDKGFTDLKAELRDEGVKSTLELISILKPKKVVFLGGNAFGLLDKYADNNLRLHFEHIKVFGKLPLEIGRLYKSGKTKCARFEKRNVQKSSTFRFAGFT
jgi:hypothetical protein